MSTVTPNEHNGYEERGEEIRLIWKQHQWLYVIVGFIIGLLFLPLVGGLSSEFLLNLVPEAIGIGFGVFVIDRLYRYWQQKRLLQLIKKELISNARELIWKSDNGINVSHIWAMPVRLKYGSSDYDGTTTVTGQYIKWLDNYMRVGGRVSQLRTDFIDSALTSDVLILLGSDKSPSEITFHEALAHLRNEIRKCVHIYEKLLPLSRETLSELKQRVPDHEEYDLPNSYIYDVMACVDRQINTIRWSKSILQSINADRNSVTVPVLQPVAPVRKEAERLIQGTPDISEAEEWILNQEV
jgi:hypothetical protein